MEIKSYDVEKIFKNWAAEAVKGDTMTCENTAKIEAEADARFEYQGRHVKKYEFAYPHGGNICTAVFTMDDDKKVEMAVPSKDHARPFDKKED